VIAVTFLPIQGGGISIGPNGVCIDCPLTKIDALKHVVILVGAVVLGIWLRRKNRSSLRTVGSFLLAFAVLELWAVNHAGIVWGIIRSTEPLEFYDRGSVWAFTLIIGALGTVSIFFFRRKRKENT
jgi:hypothetical protein